MISVGIDVDGVVAQLHTEWYRLYNEEFDDNLKVEDVTGWNIVDFVKPEARDAMIEYLNRPDLYNKIPVYKGAPEAIRTLRKYGYEIVFVSSCPESQYDQKVKWLVKHGMITDSDPYHELIAASKKHLIGTNFLIDDRPKNIEEFNGVPIIFDQLYNRDTEGYRVTDWSQIPTMINTLSLDLLSEDMET